MSWYNRSPKVKDTHKPHHPNKISPMTEKMLETTKKAVRGKSKKPPKESSTDII